jgi:manganese efflux pump family protein
MANAVTFALFLSLDTFLVSLALGTLNIGRSNERRLAALFSLCDGFASLIGHVAGGVFLSEMGLFGKLGSWVLCGYAGLVFFLGWRVRGTTRLQRGVGLFYALPFMLSLDNLVAGVSLRGLDVSFGLSILLVGSVSGLMSLLGLRLGSYAGHHSPVPRLALATAGLVTMAAVIAFC